MTLQSTHADTRTHSPPAEGTPRVLLKDEAPKTGYVDGAWWPYGDQLTTELPGLLAVLETRLGPIHHVAYHLGEWANTPRELDIAGRTVRLDGHRYRTVHTIEVLGDRDRRLVVLVVPPCTDAQDAFVAMTSASTKNDTSAVADLLMIGTREHRDRTERAAAVHRWDSEHAARVTDWVGVHGSCSPWGSRRSSSAVPQRRSRI